MTPALELQGLNAAYGEMRVLFDVSLKAPQGSVVAILGPNGAGKTTLLRLGAGLMSPVSGSVHVFGQDVTRYPARVRSRSGVCLIPEGRGIFPNLTVEENLLLHTHLRGRAKASVVQEEAYNQFPPLRARRRQISGTLSGGEQQMLALARALTTEPRVLLLDEISMGLAPAIVEGLFAAVRDLADRGISVVLVEQMVEQALRLADYAVILSQGRVRAVGEPADVQDQIVASYLGTDSAPLPTGSQPSWPAAESRHPDQVEGSTAEPIYRPADEAMVATPHGTMAHVRSCPVVAGRTDVLPARAADNLRRCGMCSVRVDSR